MSSKLNNIDTLKKMASGNHRTQTRTTKGYEKKDDGKREVGDVWTDENGFTWEQKDGYRIKKGKLNKVRTELNSELECPSCEQAMTKRLDRKYFLLNGMCMDCSIEYENKLKYSGDYEEYERKKMLGNLKGWIRDAEREKDMLKHEISKNMIMQEDGTQEKINLPYSPSEMMEKIDKDFEKLKLDLLTKYDATEEELREFGIEKEQNE
jgi:hypothetical protein